MPGSWGVTALVRPQRSVTSIASPTVSSSRARKRCHARPRSSPDSKTRTAILPFDSAHRDRDGAAQPHADRILTFGLGEGADVRAIYVVKAPQGGTMVTAGLPEGQLSFTISQPGDHWVANALAVIAAVEAVGGDLAAAGLALADLGGSREGASAGAWGTAAEALLSTRATTKSCFDGGALKVLGAEEVRGAASQAREARARAKGGRIHASLANRSAAPASICDMVGGSWPRSQKSWPRHQLGDVPDTAAEIGSRARRAKRG